MENKVVLVVDNISAKTKEFTMNYLPQDFEIVFADWNEAVLDRELPRAQIIRKRFQEHFSRNVGQGNILPSSPKIWCRCEQHRHCRRDSKRHSGCQYSRHKLSFGGRIRADDDPCCI